MPSESLDSQVLTPAHFLLGRNITNSLSNAEDPQKVESLVLLNI